MKTNRSKRVRSAKPEDVCLPVIHYIVCARAKKPDSRLEPGVKPKQKHRSILTGCKYSAKINSDALENAGYFIIAFAGDHHHLAALDLRSLPIARRMATERLEKSKRLLRSGLKTAPVLDVIKSDHGDDVWLDVERNIVNIQQYERVKELDVLTELKRYGQIEVRTMQDFKLE